MDMNRIEQAIEESIISGIKHGSKEFVITVVGFMTVSLRWVNEYFNYIGYHVRNMHCRSFNKLHH